MKEYKCIEIEPEGWETERELNHLARQGWKVICSYAKHGYWLILEKDKEICTKCGN